MCFSRIRQEGKPGGRGLPLWEKHSRQREQQVQMLRGRHVLGVFQEKQEASERRKESVTGVQERMAK